MKFLPTHHHKHVHLFIDRIIKPLAGNAPLHCRKMSINKIGILFTSPAEGTVVNYKVIRIFHPQTSSIMFLSTRIFSPTRKRICRIIKFSEPPKFISFFMIQTPSPGAVCPASVKFLALQRISDFNSILPETAKQQ